jgi:hypothetical protein
MRASLKINGVSDGNRAIENMASAIIVASSAGVKAWRHAASHAAAVESAAYQPSAEIG